MQLSNHDDYEGGNLQIMGDDNGEDDEEEIEDNFSTCLLFIHYKEDVILL